VTVNVHTLNQFLEAVIRRRNLLPPKTMFSPAEPLQELSIDGQPRFRIEQDRVQAAPDRDFHRRRMEVVR